MFYKSSKLIYLYLLFLLPTLFLSQAAQAFLTKSDSESIVAVIQDQYDKGELGGSQSIAFDRLQCKRMYCVLEFRTFDRQADFASIQAGRCVIHDMLNAYDVFDYVKAANLEEQFQLRPAFKAAIKDCLAIY